MLSNPVLVSSRARLVSTSCHATSMLLTSSRMRRLQAAPLADLLAFNKVKRKLGGKVRLILSGAAPMSTPVQQMLSCSMCAPVLQGYGLTETCAASTIAEPYKWDTIGTVGGPMPGKPHNRPPLALLRVTGSCCSLYCCQQSAPDELCPDACTYVCIWNGEHTHATKTPFVCRCSQM